MVFEHDYNNFPELTNVQLETLGFTSPHKQITEDFYAEVVKVHDGDTVTLRTDFRDFDFPLRFLNIDAPELNEGGGVTRDWLKDQILNQNVQVLINPNNRVGKYGRLLGRILYGGLDIGQQEINLGYAKEFGKKDEGKLPRLDKIFRVGQWL